MLLLLVCEVKICKICINCYGIVFIIVNKIVFDIEFCLNECERIWKICNI